MIGNKEKDFEKVKIHMGYCIFILVLLVVVLFTMIGHDNKELASQVAFGATLSGIILSILAIILTLIGETKSDNTKDNLLNISKKLEDIVGNVEGATNKLENISSKNEEFQSKIMSSVSGPIQIEKIKDCESKENNYNYKYMFETYIKICESLCYRYSEIKKIYINVFYFVLISFEKINKVTTKEFNKFVESLEVYDFEECDELVTWHIMLVFIYGIQRDEVFMEYIKKTMIDDYFEIKGKIDIMFD
ncbi:hypothetical protein [Clostridioides sp. ES-S-0190-01]|uniref:hypothetical protein n=1 Tax=Clostridioides sp. ES-S-0190-01 TaxID=2770787 RepID=UPI001D10A89D|nr:hypothetical protein [Clostridioides sp. ES-S-0190-01]